MVYCSKLNYSVVACDCDMIGGFGISVKSDMTCDKDQILVDIPNVTTGSSMPYGDDHR